MSETRDDASPKADGAAEGGAEGGAEGAADGLAAPRGGAVADYKRVLRAVCDNRPSGTRGRLASALGTNRSFVSQLVNPTYAMPIPAQHLPAIFEVCRFQPAERAAFLDAYDRAHPGRREPAADMPRLRVVSVTVPDLGQGRANQAVDAMLHDFARGLVRLLAKVGD